MSRTFMFLCIILIFSCGQDTSKNTETVDQKDKLAPKQNIPEPENTPTPSKPVPFKVMPLTKSELELLKNPKDKKNNLKCPDTFKVEFSTSKGKFTIEVTRKWSPRGADKFYNMVRARYFEEVKLFRVVPNFMAQFGMHGNPLVNGPWSEATINDDPSLRGISNTRGMITYAKTGQPNSRSNQFFINFKNNSFLDRQNFTPFGKVIKGMEVVDSFYKGYGERTTQLQGTIAEKGNAFLEKNFPELDYVKYARLID